ncbi:uncharacterized protein LOC126789917 isoform X2 [Argentina anserina]|uniref:uncharacterized protein LOC126789917 isoform X2 n=1 Tax=Argentina anserina TaxID=57926 RepID=UPI0021763F94|nr:uncharacterized protein LOC126789917 isoform X2 [Potentilla anserina]
MGSTSTSRMLSPARTVVQFQSSSSTHDPDEEVSLNLMGTIFKVKSSATIKDLKAIICNKYKIGDNYPEFLLAGHPLMDFQRDTIEIEAKPEDTIQKIKIMIHAKKKFQPDLFTLVYDGKLLEDDMTLASEDLRNESILYMVSAPKDIISISVKAPTGETFKFKVKPLFTVRDVKTIVESYTGFSVSDHNLIYSGNELEDLKTLAFYDIEDESVLEVSPPYFHIFVKVCDGKLISIDVKPSDSVKELKSMIFRKLNVSLMPLDFYKLVFHWEQLDEIRDLASYNIRKGSKLRLVLSSSVIVRD